MDQLATFSGHIVTSEDPDYAQARTTHLAQGQPALVLCPANDADVSLALGYAREHQLTLSVRSGGHHAAGFGTNQGGVVLDLGHLCGVEVLDAARGLVRLEPGATWGQVATALAPHGLAISSGDTASVGVGGLTLGGGIGLLVRQAGLTIDSLQAANIITADGVQRRVSATEHADLFWAIRGGGGNFGVVTSFEFTALPVAEVFAGAITYPMSELARVLKGWRDYMRTASEQLNSTFFIFPGQEPSIAIRYCFGSDDEVAATAAIAPLAQLGSAPVPHQISRTPYGQLLGEIPPPPPHRKPLMVSAYINEFTDAVIGDIVAGFGQPSAMLQIRSLGGAVTRLASDATAFAHRDSEVLLLSPRAFAGDATDAAIAQALEPWQQVARHGQGPSANFWSNPAGAAQAIYPAATHRRLMQVKDRYDPHNLFDQNFNIK